MTNLCKACFLFVGLICMTFGLNGPGAWASEMNPVNASAATASTSVSAPPIITLADAEAAVLNNAASPRTNLLDRRGGQSDAGAGWCGVHGNYTGSYSNHMSRYHSGSNSPSPSPSPSQPHGNVSLAKGMVAMGTLGALAGSLAPEPVQGAAIGAAVGIGAAFVGQKLGVFGQ